MPLGRLPQSIRVLLVLAVAFFTGAFGFAFEGPASQVGAAGQPVRSRQSRPVRVVSPLRGMKNRLAVGDKLPAFEAQDHTGRTRNLETLKGPNGLYLLIVKSADW